MSVNNHKLLSIIDCPYYFYYYMFYEFFLITVLY